MQITNTPDFLSPAASQPQNPHSGQAFSRSVDHLSASFSRFEKQPGKHGY
jgi:hypothetical protein